MTSFSFVSPKERAKSSALIVLATLLEHWISDTSYVALPPDKDFRIGPGCRFRMWYVVQVTKVVKAGDGSPAVAVGDTIIFEGNTMPHQSGTNAAYAKAVAETAELVYFFQDVRSGAGHKARDAMNWEATATVSYQPGIPTSEFPVTHE
ncbi:hypothetical protein DIPPA_12875 [Diplonema papillatum]|nr:hypothetical protein DIPPA_12875 [Diplonema papillatum]